MREFKSGATRDDDTDKLDYEGFESPVVLRRFAQYMHQHRTQKNNKSRASDNWQKGIPLEALMKSIIRHTIDAWGIHRGDWLTGTEGESMEELLCAIRFNVNGYLHGVLKRPVASPPLKITNPCDTCRFRQTPQEIPPCSDCLAAASQYSKWEPKTPEPLVKRNCLNCNARCCGNCIKQDNWEPKTNG